MKGDFTRSTLIAIGLAAVSLAVLAVFSGLNYFAAENHRSAEVEEWERIQTHQRAAATWMCLDTKFFFGLNANDERGAGFQETISEMCADLFGDEIDRYLLGLDED